LICLAAFLVVLSVMPRSGSSHEPITTKVMFNKEVIRILQRNCLGCHSPGKIKADISLTTYEEARPWAKAIKEEVLEKRMMPYQPVKGFGSFQHDYVLSQREIDLLVSWIEGGAPRGEEKDYPKQSIEELAQGGAWPLGQPDLVLQPGVEAHIAAEGADEDRCFVLPTKLKEDRWISAVDFRPGNGAVVHSASFFLERAFPPRAAKAAKRSGAACLTNDEEANLENFGQWVPGQAAHRLPSGIARLLPANSRVVLKVRYRKSGEAMKDRSSIGLYFNRDQINKTTRSVTINAPQTTVPANAERHRIKAIYPINEATEAVAVRPLLFPFAHSVEVRAYRPDGAIEVLIWVKNYRFDWQPAYYFKQPIPLPKGARIEATAYLDNSDNNPRRPNDSSNPMRFAGPLCELELTTVLPAKQAMR
jgi:hypothetical protein